MRRHDTAAVGVSTRLRRFPHRRHVVCGIDRERRRFEDPFDRREQADEWRRDELGEKREIADVDDGSLGVAIKMVWQQPPLHTLVNAVERRKYITHVETKQDVSRVDLVDEEQAARLQDANELYKGGTLVGYRWQVVQDVDGIHEIVGPGRRRNREPGSD